MNLGLKVMINALAGHNGAEHLTASIGKVIKSAALTDNKLSLRFEDGTGIALVDDGQSCCESRYMTTDDDIAWLNGQTLRGVELRDAPSPEKKDTYDEDHEIQFLAVLTEQGEVVLANHNEHNGYYGGFSIAAQPLPSEATPEPK